MQKVSRFVMLIVLTGSVLYSVGSQAQFARSNEPGAVFVMNNSASRNEIISFARAADGLASQSWNVCHWRQGIRGRKRSAGVPGFTHAKSGSLSVVRGQRRQRGNFRVQGLGF